MPEITLSSGPVEYHDTGTGPVLVLLHGLLTDASLWDATTARLAGTHRCVAPTLPLGAHRLAVRPGTDLSLPALAGLVEEFLAALDLHDVTVVGVDTGGALVQLLMARRSERVGRAVLVSCDAFENFPPGATGQVLVATGLLPPALFWLAMQQLRLRPLRRLPITFGRLTRRGDAAVRRSLEPLLTRPDVRRDTVRVLRAIAADRRLLVEVAERLPAFDRPTLIAWAREDRVMPPAHAYRLAALLPDARVVEIDDSATFVPLDQPGPLADALAAFAPAPATTRLPPDVGNRPATPTPG